MERGQKSRRGYPNGRIPLAAEAGPCRARGTLMARGGDSLSIITAHRPAQNPSPTRPASHSLYSILVSTRNALKTRRRACPGQERPFAERRRRYDTRMVRYLHARLPNTH